MTIGEAVAPAGGDFEKHAFLRGKHGFFFCDEPRMGQDIDARRDGGAVRAGQNRLDDCFAVHHDNFRPQRPGL